MKRLDLRKYCYVFLWLGLLLTVGLVWFFGGASLRRETETGSVPAVSAAPSSAPVREELNLPEPKKGPEMAGVWVPYMALSTEEHTQAAFEENFRKIADSAREKGLNALFVHVRPFCDALYPSETYPWSHILTGEQGEDPGFDPLAFMVEYAHSQGLEFHAWINPLRVKTTETPAALSEDNPYLVLGEDYPYYFMESGGGVYLDPAYPYVRSLIASGAAEIVENYQVDGIHFDDYFYPSKGEDLDKEAYEIYTQSVETPLPLLEWRQTNINAMVQETYEKIKAANPEAVFGISPQGNLGNDEEMGADVKAWCAVEGYVDYICPQLYYSFENPALGYTDALEQWTSLTRHPELELYAGLALYKAGSEADEGTWLLSDDVIRRQIETAEAAQCAGVVLYSSQYLDVEQTAKEMDNALEVLAPAEDKEGGS